MLGNTSCYVERYDIIRDFFIYPSSALLMWVARYSGWLDAVQKIWMTEGVRGMFRGSIPRITWYIPASALTFMAVEFLREHFNEELDNDVASLSVETTSSSLQEVS